MTGNTDYAIRQPPTTCANSAANSSWPNLVGPAATTSTTHGRRHRRLLTLREQVIRPILASVRSPRRGRKPTTWTQIDRDYETSASTCRPSSTTSASQRQPPHRQLLVDRRSVSA